jgi:hypothetical protein
MRPMTLAATAALVMTMSAAAAAQPFPGAVQPDPTNHPDWWVPCSSSIAIDRGLGCDRPRPTATPLRTALTAPPTEDEFYTYDPYGVGTPQSFKVRTADRAQWLQGGKRYRHAYNVEMVVGRTEFRCEDIGYGEVCDLFQIGTVTYSANVVGLEVGREIPFRLFAPAGPWVRVD